MARLPTLLVPDSASAPGVRRGEVPLEFIQRWIRQRMPEMGHRGASPADRILIVLAATGAGKSTVLPVGLYRLLRGREPGSRPGEPFRGPGVLCTQPRVLTAMTLAADVSAERLIGGRRARLNPDMVLGETVGFQTGPISNSPPAGLVFATAGVLAAQLRVLSDAELAGRYRVIQVDEAHERSQDTDMLMMALRHFYERNAGNPRLPFLLLTSATFEPRTFAAFFGLSEANVVRIKGRAFKIAQHFAPRPVADYTAAAADAVLAIHRRVPAERADPPEQADILVFVPGAAEARAVAERLEQANEQLATEPLGPLLVLKVDRRAVVEQTPAYGLVFAPSAELPRIGARAPRRRVVIATAVAETGLTIDTLRYVVDCGWGRTREVYQPGGTEGLVTRPAARSRVAQRMGRAGRLFDGEFHALYPAEAFAALEEQQAPDIVSSGAGAIVLALVQEQQRQKLRQGRLPEFRAEDIALPDPPPPEAYLAAFAAATALGFLSARAPLPRRWPPRMLAEAVADETEGETVLPLAAARGYGLTALGHLAALFTRTTPEGVRMLLAGYAWGCAATDLVTAAAMLGQTLAGLLSRRELRRKTGPPPGGPALRAALPPFLAEKVGGLEAGPTADEATAFRARLALADDFAEAILIFDAFRRQLDAARGAVAAVVAWCDGLGLSFQALTELAQRRESVIEEMLVAGLNPFRLYERRLAALAAADFGPGLVALKRCLYDGLRLRLLRFEPGGADGHPPAYVTYQGLRVRGPGLFSDAAFARLRALKLFQPGEEGAARYPRWIVTDAVRIVPAPKRAGAPAPLLYATALGLVCVLDGFVDPDPGMVEPRAAPAQSDKTEAALAAALPGKLGPARAGPAGGPGRARARVAAYLRALRAAGGGRPPPAARLTRDGFLTLFGRSLSPPRRPETPPP